jgi:5-methylcytosine-specific restriction endonuclease McrA
VTSDPRSHRRYREQVAEVRARWAAQDRRCFICSQPIDYDLPATEEWGCTVEHIVPLSKDRDQHYNPRNWAPAHRRCNVSQGVRRRPALYGPAGPSGDW